MAVSSERGLRWSASTLARAAGAYLRRLTRSAWVRPKSAVSEPLMMPERTSSTGRTTETRMISAGFIGRERSSAVRPALLDHPLDVSPRIERLLDPGEQGLVACLRPF